MGYISDVKEMKKKSRFPVDNEWTTDKYFD
jgi:hypothetical protein